MPSGPAAGEEREKWPQSNTELRAHTWGRADQPPKHPFSWDFLPRIPMTHFHTCHRCVRNETFVPVTMSCDKVARIAWAFSMAWGLLLAARREVQMPAPELSYPWCSSSYSPLNKADISGAGSFRRKEGNFHQLGLDDPVGWLSPLIPKWWPEQWRSFTTPAGCAVAGLVAGLLSQWDTSEVTGGEGIFSLVPSEWQ